MNKEQEIREYLQGPRDYRQGVALYNKYGFNLMMKRRFAIHESESTKEIMIEELRKLAGLNISDMRTMQRKAVARVSAPMKEQPSISPLLENGNKPAPETVTKMIKFREKYPFLNSPDCPDVLKILVADMFTAYGDYTRALEELQKHEETESTLETARLCEQIVESYLENRAIWEELDYYKEHGTLLGKVEKVKEARDACNIESLSDLDLMGKLKSAQVNVSKRTKTYNSLKDSGDVESIEKARTTLQLWQAKKAAFEAEIERRKKK